MLFSHNNHTASVHGRNTQEDINLQFKWAEILAAKEREDREEALAKLRQNKADITAPKAVQTAPQPHAHPVLDKIKHVLHLS